MWSFVLFISLIPWAAGQRSGHSKVLRNSRQLEHGTGWDIRLAVPGEPGSDYPTLGAIPRTSFSCSGKTPGYYADLETSCQVFRVCTAGSTYGFQSFLCPNGTLFNQAVFVCDWWMNVNCQQSQELFVTNNDRFGNLRLGPQLMKDVKNMLTHPMSNPYDKTAMKGNLIVMQEYQPPFGQMFPNGAFLSAPDRPSNVYIPANQNLLGSAFAASSPSPTYVPPFNTVNTANNAETFHRQNSQFAQSGKLIQAPQSNVISNGHSGQYTYTENHNAFLNNGHANSQQTQFFNQQSQRQSNYVTGQNNGHAQRGQITYQSSQYNNNRISSQSGKQGEFGNAFTKQQYYSSNSQKQPYTYNAPSNRIRQNPVSTNIPTTLQTFGRLIQEPKPSPKPRITFKTWIVKPSKAAKLTAEATAYTYNRPTQPTAAKIINEPSPYIYNPPPTTAQTARLVAPDNSYTYNRPTLAAKVVATTPAEAGYAYNRPTIAAKIIATTIRQPSRSYLTPTAPPPTLSRLYLKPTSAPPTLAAKLYLAPTTYKPAAKFYLPPSTANTILSRQYLAPGGIQQPAYYQQSDKLRAAPTALTPVVVSPTNDITNSPSFSLTKQSRYNANHNNLTFTDILTKEKLDITVNDIVSDTSKVLKTASPQFEQYRQDKTPDYSEVYLPPENESDENLTPQTATVATSARLVENPSRTLEPPVESYNNNNVQTSNRFANLPFFKEPATNTIERTVSLKISIPEKVASFLFRNHTENDYDKLEILNTGSSNYLVLTNNLLNKNSGNFIPIGKLISDKESNVSNSQALVFSILADSLNEAKKYNNIVQQNIIASTSPSHGQQFQQHSNEDISQITNQISQLTAAQYSVNNHNFNPTITASKSQSTSNSDDFHKAAKYTATSQNQHQETHNAQFNSVTQSSTGYPARVQSAPAKIVQPNNQIYSGQLYQLPVPEVTNQFYNIGSRVVQTQPQTTTSSINSGSNHDVVNNEIGKHSAEVELVHSKEISHSAPAKLQAAPTHEQFNSEEHSTQALNILNGSGISAQINDKIVGTIPHPSENKLVTYKKDQSYFVYTKLSEDFDKVQDTSQINNIAQQSAKLIQNPTPNVVTIQLVPSVSYQLEEKDQQKFLNAFNIDEFGNPKKVNESPKNHDVSTEFAVNNSAKQVDGRFGELNTLYAGQSSYLAPQASVGSLNQRDGQTNVQYSNTNNARARVEQYQQGGENGYA